MNTSSTNPGRLLGEARGRFETAWREGRAPRVEDYLAEAAPDDRQPLLLALLESEVGLRRERGEFPDEGDYLVRFPADAGLVKEVFRRGPNGSDAPLPGPLWLGEGVATQNDATHGPTRTFSEGGGHARPDGGADDPGPTTQPNSTEFWGDPRDSPAPASVVPQAAIGRYRLESLLGEGGFGRVFLAFDEELHRYVAIKLPRANAFASQRHVEAFLNEAQLAAGLTHRGIVTVHDVGRQADGSIYVILEYIDGVSLGALLKSQRLDHATAVHLILGVADAVQYAHKQGLIHRDLKPDNILLDRDGNPHVADFGLAIREEQLLRMAEQVAGTPAYMSPEQVRGEGHRLNARTDLWALGVVFYQMLTGTVPFTGGRREVFQSVLNRDPRPPRLVDGSVPKELERVCMKCLAKRMTERYAQVSDFADDLRAWLASLSEPPGQSPSARGGPGSSRAAEADPAAKVVPKGLRAFDSMDADFFLELLPGPRDRHGLPESLRFWKMRVEETDPDKTFSVGLLYGPSGCGKSSLVKAGLLPGLDGRVIPVYVEATAGETGARLLANLARACPGVADAGDLPAMIAAVREGGGPPGKKVLLVVDQFEQWLHAGGGRDDDQLALALRQCDGGHVQCLLMVRDDFWMAITRFMRSLEIRLVEGQNSAPVDLFDPDHARKVLVEFGRAFGRLPDAPAEPSAEQARFLERSIDALKRRDGRIVPVGLSLFVEMMRDKPWAPAALKSAGGFRGIGVRFLEETFSAPTAPPGHRAHQGAARVVLKMLLPEEKSDIRGRLRSYRELLEASDYRDREGDFVDLLHILDTELRLITPTDLEGSERVSATRESANRGEKFFQLTHDYLVPTIRQWLTLKQSETLEGRVELRLVERAALWESYPDTRHLLSWWELLGVLAFSRKPLWTAPQRKLVAASSWHHSVRGVVVAAALAGLTLLGYEVVGRFEARSLLDTLRGASTTEAPAVVRKMGPYRRWLDPLLAAEVARPSADDDGRKRLHARLALLESDPGQVPFLFDRLLAAEPAEFLVIRSSLRPHRDRLKAQLWRLVEGPETENDRRFRAACALADFDPDDHRHRKASPAVVSTLTAQSPLALGDWIEALRPVRDDLTAALIRVFNDHDSPDGYVATCVLADYLSADPDALLGLALDASPRQLSALIPALKRGGPRVLPAVKRAFDVGPPPDAPGDQAALANKRRSNAAAVLVELGRGERVWPHLKAQPDPTLRTALIHQFGPSQVDPLVLIHQFEAAAEGSVRQALILALGEYGKGFISAGKQIELTARLLTLYRDDPDPATHSSAEWLLRRWGNGEALARADAELASPGPSPGRRWFVNRHRHTFALIRGPVELAVKDDTGSSKVRVPRSFALATKEVTREQFNLYRGKTPPANTDPAYLRRPMDMVSWYDAARYCRWLSEREGIPEEEMCYPPVDQIREGMTLAPGYLERTGYRLPTEPEWEYACRAGSAFDRPFGAEERWVPKYAWTVLSADGHAWPVGLLKPNDLGLFDTLGNVFEWCRGFPPRGALATGEAVEDRENLSALEGDGYQRGASFESRLMHVTCRFRNRHPLSVQSRPVGFRVAKTCE